MPIITQNNAWKSVSVKYVLPMHPNPEYDHSNFMVELGELYM